MLASSDACSRRALAAASWASICCTLCRLTATFSRARSTLAWLGTEGVGSADAVPLIGRVTAKVVAAAMAMRATGRTGNVPFVGGLALLPHHARQIRR